VTRPQRNPQPTHPSPVAVASPWLSRIARLCGVPLGELVPLAAAFAREAERTRTARSARAGLPPQAITTLLGLYLGMTGLGLGLTAVLNRATPGAAAAALLTVQGMVVGGFAFSGLFPLLLDDADFRVLAAWPIAPGSYLLAKLLPPTRRALAATLLLCAPSSLVLGIAAGTPLVTGLVFLIVALVGAVILLWYVAALYALLLRLVGAARLRALALVAQAGIVLAPLGGVALASPRTTRAFATLPAALPSSWGAAWVELSARHADARTLLLAGLGLAAAAALPLVFRAAAVGYGRGLATARVHAGRSWLLVPVAALARQRRRPADRALGLIFVAHARHDWRFRAQLLAVPTLTLALALAARGGLPVARLFADPFVPLSFPHPALLFVILALVPPILAVPTLTSSSDHGAAWLLRAGVLPATALQAATRRLLRLVLLVPLLVAVSAGYLLAHTPPAHALMHLAMLTLIGDATLIGMQAWLPMLPFSLPRDNHALAERLMAAMLLAYVLSGIIAATVVHLVYRSWPVWVAAVVFLLYVRRDLGRRAATAAARRAADRESDVVVWSLASDER
jgi:hypothetical protein